MTQAGLRAISPGKHIDFSINGAYKTSISKDMSKIQMYGRPWAVFDPKNKDHRRWFADFNQNASWANCPVRFAVDDDAGDLITMIQHKLIAYYTEKEFGKKQNGEKNI